MHVPQVFYFVGFSSLLGWPVLVSGKEGPSGLVKEIWKRMFGSRRYLARRCSAVRACPGIGMLT